MGWFSRITRFGDTHIVFAQERDISCGLACVIMAAFKINKIKPGARAIFSEDDILAKATALLGPNPLGTAGLNNPQLVQLLNHPDLKMPGWRLSTISAAQVPAQIARKVGVTSGLGFVLNVKPIIVGIDWAGGGGHWVIVDTVRDFMGSTYATVCDPWDGNVHVTKLDLTTTFRYTGVPAPGISIGPHFDYQTKVSGGAFIGDIIER